MENHSPNPDQHTLKINRPHHHGQYEHSFSLCAENNNAPKG